MSIKHDQYHPDMFPALGRQIRGEIIEISHSSDAMHLGSCLSCVDILIYLYSSFLSIKPDDPDWDERDRFILSKGHASLALYTVLAHCGFFPRELLRTFNAKESDRRSRARFRPIARCAQRRHASRGS